MKLLDFIYTLLGQGIVFIIILIIILFIIAITLGKILLKKNIIIFPRFILFVVDVFYSPFKTIARLLKIDDDMIDRISIEVRDDVNKEKFKKIPAEETLIFLPHCLRHRDCQAKRRSNLYRMRQMFHWSYQKKGRQTGIQFIYCSRIKLC